MTSRIRIQFVVFAIVLALASAFTVPFNAASSTMVSSSTSSRLNMAGPATLEPKTAEPEIKEKKEESTKSEEKYKKGGWAVRLFNDPMNKREFVAMCLSKITGLTDGQAYQVMMQAHQNGVSVVGRYDQERAELYRDSLQENGLVVDMVPVEDD